MLQTILLLLVVLLLCWYSSFFSVVIIAITLGGFFIGVQQYINIILTNRLYSTYGTISWIFWDYNILTLHELLPFAQLKKACKTPTDRPSGARGGGWGRGRLLNWINFQYSLKRQEASNRLREETAPGNCGQIVGLSEGHCCKAY